MENAFERYIDLTDEVHYLYANDDNEDHEDDELDEISLEKLSSISEKFTNIENDFERFIAICNYFTQEFEAAEDLEKTQELSTIFSTLIRNDFDDFEPNESQMEACSTAVMEVAKAYAKKISQYSE